MLFKNPKHTEAFTGMADISDLGNKYGLIGTFFLPLPKEGLPTDFDNLEEAKMTSILA